MYYYNNNRYKTHIMNDRKRRFCEEYVSNGYNPALAYQIAYQHLTEQKCTGANKKWGPPARELLKQDCVKEYIKELQRERIEAQAISAERCLEKLASIAFHDNCSGEEDEEYIAIRDQLKAIDMMLKMNGWDKPVENDSREVVINVSVENKQSDIQ